VNGRALVIVGHGSARNPNTRKPICSAVKAIKARGIFDEVRCGLWKEDPHISITLNALHSRFITIVPFFISKGYYTEQVIPREMKLSGPITFRDDKVIRYCDPVGSHPLFAELIVERARAVGAMGDETLVVLGHGTPKNPNSAKNVFLQAERVATMNAFPQVLTLFIDQEPHLSSVYEMATGKRIVVVPLFVADGWHVSETIPEDLEGIQNDGRELVYASAVGTDPRVVDLILDGAAVDIDVAEGPLIASD